MHRPREDREENLETPFTIRRCAPNDASIVAPLAARLFVQAYGATHPEPELGHYVARTFPEEGFREWLADPTQAVFIALDSNSRGIGYAYVRPSTGNTPAGVSGTTVFELMRMYVDANHHGLGVAAALMEAGIANARANGADTLWLAVWQNAARPIAFYSRFGFHIVGTTTFKWGDGFDDDFIMSRSI